MAAFLKGSHSLYMGRVLLLDDLNREDKVTTADVVNHIQTLDNLTKAGVHSVKVLGVLAIHTDKEL